MRTKIEDEGAYCQWDTDTDSISIGVDCSGLEAVHVELNGTDQNPDFFRRMADMLYRFADTYEEVSLMGETDESDSDDDD